MKYSVIIPIYNMEKYLNECIVSVLSQKRDDVELILVNDGSIDNTIHICNNFKKKYKNVIVIDKKNTGSMDSWISGVKVAKGKYICFIDSDDKISDNYFETIDKYVANDEYDVILFDFYRMYKNYNLKAKVNKLPYGELSSEKLENLKNTFFENYDMYSLYRWDKVIKSNIIKENIKKIKIRSIYFEDHLISFLNLLSSNKIYYANEILYFYRMRKSSVSHSNKINQKNFIDNISISNEIINIAKEKKYSEEQIYKINLYFLYHYARSSLKSSSFPEIKKVTFKDIENINFLEGKLILLLYKFKLRFFFNLLSKYKYKKSNKNKVYFD